jgi:hypothetical protein
MRLVRLLAVFAFVTAFSSALFATVPELDPGNVVSVGMLLGGVLLVIRSRKK